MTDPNFVFKFGKHVGKTYAWVEEHHPTYIDWVKKEAPHMLKAKAAAKPKTTVTQLDDNPKSLQPNLNFYNEGPDPMSLPYLRKMAEQKANSGETKSFFDLDI
jgi:hypothetical protein